MPAAADVVRDAERRGDAAKRALFGALRAAFVTPMEPEDVFALSRGIDRILDYARDLVTESEVMDSAPDEVIAEMAGHLGEALRHIDQALFIPRRRRGRRDRRRRFRDHSRAKPRACLLPRNGGPSRSRGRARTDRPPRVLPRLRPDRRARDRRRRANHLRRRETELTAPECCGSRSQTLRSAPKKRGCAADETWGAVRRSGEHDGSRRYGACSSRRDRQCWQ